LVAVEVCCDGATRLALELARDASVCKVWPHAFRFRLEIMLGNAFTAFCGLFFTLALIAASPFFFFNPNPNCSFQQEMDAKAHCHADAPLSCKTGEQGGIEVAMVTMVTKHT
jgi:hypothetical protein